MHYFLFFFIDKEKTLEEKDTSPGINLLPKNYVNPLQKLLYFMCILYTSGEYYIGSTTRCLHDRTKEHLANDNSSVTKHLTTHHRNHNHNIEVKVITRENDPVNLRLHEAYYIRK